MVRFFLDLYSSPSNQPHQAHHVVPEAGESVRARVMECQLCKFHAIVFAKRPSGPVRVASVSSCN